HGVPAARLLPGFDGSGGVPLVRPRSFLRGGARWIHGHARGRRVPVAARSARAPRRPVGHGALPDEAAVGAAERHQGRCRGSRAMMAASPLGRRKIVIPGGTGHVGSALSRAFHEAGDEVVVLSRRPRLLPWRSVPWDAESLGPWTSELEGAEAVI